GQGIINNIMALQIKAKHKVHNINMLCGFVANYDRFSAKDGLSCIMLRSNFNKILSCLTIFLFAPFEIQSWPVLPAAGASERVFTRSLCLRAENDLPILCREADKGLRSSPEPPHARSSLPARSHRDLRAVLRLRPPLRENLNPCPTSPSPAPSRSAC
ncbi:MAG: hypothetical protein PHI71_06845, partial [Acidiphilium sp.]|nr:hypothetical protein [Acidiphilium sp.]